MQYTCILNPIVYNASVSIIWAGSAFNCSASNNTITLTQSASGSLNTSIVMCGNVSAVMTKINGSCYWSVLTISDPIYFNGSTIKCYDGNNAGFIWSDELKQQFKGRCITLVYCIMCVLKYLYKHCAIILLLIYLVLTFWHDIPS